MYFPDERKSVGAYVTVTEHLKKTDSIERMAVLTDGTEIPFDDVVDIESELFANMKF